MRTSRGVLGIGLALASGLAFGAGGVIVKPLLEAGWSPGAAVFARMSVAALLLALPGLWALRFDLRPLWHARWTVLAIALIAMVGTQVAYYAALATIPVSTALLIEYLAPVALVLVAWLRHRHAPQLVVLGGSVLAIAGLVLVIGPGGGGLDPVGLVLAGIAMVGVCVYFVVGERADASLPPIALAASGFVVGAIALGLLGVTNVVPFTAEFVTVGFFGADVPWWVPVVAVGALSSAFAYVAGITAITMLGARLSSFLGLSEVVFAAIVAWIVLGEALSPLQLLGGIAILAGIVLVRLEKPTADPAARALDIEAVPAPAPERPVAPRAPAPRA